MLEIRARIHSTLYISSSTDENNEGYEFSCCIHVPRVVELIIERVRAERATRSREITHGDGSNPAKRRGLRDFGR